MSDLKSKLEDKAIQSYSWLESKEMIADLLTKEGVNAEDILDILHENVFKQAMDNFVTFIIGEIRKENDSVKSGSEKIPNDEDMSSEDG